MRAAPSEQPPPGSIGKYELLRELARGGMAVLYLAREVGIEGFEKVVVVKRILPELVDKREFLDMFLDEARIAASLEHPNMPHVYELGRDRGEYFFAMEYLHGADARTIVKTLAAQRRELPLEHAISIVLGLCSALHYAHEKRGSDGAPLKLVHRDVSPKNVFVTYDGGVKLLDFGIAQAENKRSETSTGTVKGTIQYLSPEQINADDVDRRADVFAASILLWELTCGRALFTGSADYQIMSRIVERDAPAPSTVVPGYPPELEAIVMKGLHRDRELRFQTAEDLQLELEAFVRAQRLATSPVGLARYMRDVFAAEAAAYESAKQRGKLAACALEEVTAQAKPEPAPTPLAVTDSPNTAEPLPAKATRRVSPSAPRSRTAIWLALVMVVAVVGAGAWYLFAGPDHPGVAPSQATTAPARAVVPVPSPPIVIPPDAPEPPPVTSTPQRPPARHVRVEHKTPPPAPPPAAPNTDPRPLSSQDLDSVLPPHH